MAWTYHSGIHPILLLLLLIAVTVTDTWLWLRRFTTEAVPPSPILWSLSLVLIILAFLLLPALTILTSRHLYRSALKAAARISASTIFVSAISVSCVLILATVTPDIIANNHAALTTRSVLTVLDIIMMIALLAMLPVVDLDTSRGLYFFTVTIIPATISVIAIHAAATVLSAANVSTPVAVNAPRLVVAEAPIASPAEVIITGTVAAVLVVAAIVIVGHFPTLVPISDDLVAGIRGEESPYKGMDKNKSYHDIIHNNC